MKRSLPVCLSDVWQQMHGRSLMVAIL